MQVQMAIMLLYTICYKYFSAYPFVRGRLLAISAWVEKLIKISQYVQLDRNQRN